MQEHISKMLSSAQRMTTKEIDDRLDEIEQERLVLLAVRSFVVATEPMPVLVPLRLPSSNRQVSKRDEFLSWCVACLDAHGQIRFSDLMSVCGVSRGTLDNRINEFGRYVVRLKQGYFQLTGEGERLCEELQSSVRASTAAPSQESAPTQASG